MKNWLRSSARTSNYLMLCHRLKIKIKIKKEHDSLTLLESNRMFKFLKSELELYYRERKRPQDVQTLYTDQTPAWREHFYLNLQILLNEITYTNDKQIKTYLITKVYKWYTERTKRGLKKANIFIERPKKEEPLVPIIPQDIERSVSPERKMILPKIPKIIHVSLEDNRGRLTAYPFSARETMSQSPVSPPKSRHTLRPYLKSDAVVVDFRSFSKSISPEGLRNTNYTDRESTEEPVKVSEEIKVPLIKRDQIKEIGTVKKRLASKRLTMPLNVLEGALTFSDFTSKAFSPDSFPKGGELLLKRPPFASHKKKKKKPKASTDSIPE